MTDFGSDQQTAARPKPAIGTAMPGIQKPTAIQSGCPV